MLKVAKGFCFGGRPRYVEFELEIIMGACFVDNILTSRTSLRLSITIPFLSSRVIISPLFNWYDITKLGIYILLYRTVPIYAS